MSWATQALSKGRGKFYHCYPSQAVSLLDFNFQGGLVKELTPVLWCNRTVGFNFIQTYLTYKSQHSIKMLSLSTNF